MIQRFRDLPEIHDAILPLVKEQLIPAYRTMKVDECFGLELEMSLLRPDGSLALLGDDFVENCQVQGSTLTGEFLQSVLELVTDPFVFQPGCFDRCLGVLRAANSKICAYAARQDVDVLMAGMPFTLPDEVEQLLYENYGNPDAGAPRVLTNHPTKPGTYWEVWDQCRKLSEYERSEMETPSGLPIRIGVPHEGLVAGIHLNTSSTFDRWLPRRRAQIALAAPLMALAAGTPFFNGKLTGWQSTRYHVFPLSIYGDHRNVYPLAPGGMCECGDIADVIAHALRGEVPLLRRPSEEVRSDPLKLLNHLLGLSFADLRIRCPRTHLQDEFRIFESHPVADTVALTFATLGFIEAYLADWPDGLSEFGYGNAQRNLHEATRFGLQARGKFPGFDGEPTMADVCQVMLHKAMQWYLGNGFTKAELQPHADIVQQKIAHGNFAELVTGWYSQGAELDEIQRVVAYHSRQETPSTDWPLEFSSAQCNVAF
ncbi:MAG: hypothetical protein KDD69_06615 [Bdellovibrionales bacterium]|nr:hypothetical protein [Bdellovibrionales bacterium]